MCPVQVYVRDKAQGTAGVVGGDEGSPAMVRSDGGAGEQGMEADKERHGEEEKVCNIDLAESPEWVRLD